MSDLREKRVELILQQMEELPTLPSVAVRVLEVTGSQDSSVAEVIKLISSDPSLSAKILKLAHRSDIGMRNEVGTVDRAVVLLGFEAVRSAVLAVTVFETFIRPSSKKGARFSREEFWKHSLAVACCAEMLAEELALHATGNIPDQEISSSRESFVRVNAPDPSHAFVCGLLHDLGKIALDAMLPKSFDRVIEAAELLRGNIADVERSVIGLNHMVVGKRLAEKWHLPMTLRDCIWLHGQAPDALPSTVSDARLVNLITLADLLVRQQHLGHSGNYAFPIPRQTLLDAVGLTETQVKTVLHHLVEQIEPRAVALGLGQATTQELYQQAMAHANRELGRVSNQLAAKNKRLAIRAKFFDTLNEFQSELRPDASPQLVLQAIGQTAVSVMGVSSAASFSILHGQNFAEVLLFDEAGELFDSSLVDCPVRPPVPVTGDGPVLSAGDEMEWLLTAISPRLGHDQRFWICLEADGLCIGGILWGAPKGESQRLSTQTNELSALASGWGLALRTAQVREESRALAEQLAEVNRRLNSAQGEILRSKTMVSLGELAAGAAHEMNNPLAVISGRSQLLASQLPDPKLKHAAALIHEQADRLSQIISDLMEFAKPIPAKPVSIEPADLIGHALHDAKMRTDPADRTIEVTMEDVPQVSADEEQVAAAMTEVIGNAIQATDPTKGHIAIHAAFDPTSDRVVVQIIDNGHGMEEEIVKRAFDPFFSSKPAGRRRGLGLPKALRWVESSGGSMRLESRPEQGTRVLILLPVARAGK